ncbi:hypothetical protein EIP91_004340 [Steccherinum ochraceum]|uniref:Uncharacterized protein n=1 Tax=Steccherinum ochraceum TaxID=92696 RepID=A0A4R0RKB9_9APHY|nr:hypothetical protein EIP91_004340 [Steccherinum ochraceum]
MTSHRFTTVHDLTALRIHPDGSRVAVNGKGKSKRVVRDQRGNYVSQDAAGPLGIKQRRAAVDDEDEEIGEVFDLTGLGELTGDSASADKGKRKADHAEEDSRPSSLGVANFAAGPSTLPDTTAEDEALVKDLTSAHSIPNPSSDLLKCIHHMASKYYHEMGQLEDVTRETRKERRRRRRLKLGLSDSTAQVPKTPRGSSIDDSSSEESSEDGSLEQIEEDVDEEADRSSTVDLFGEREAGAEDEQDFASSEESDEDGSVDEWKATYADQDMYKMFDGSALMVIGMLMQEYVAELVDVEPSLADGSQERLLLLCVFFFNLGIRRLQLSDFIDEDHKDHSINQLLSSMGFVNNLVVDCSLADNSM